MVPEGGEWDTADDGTQDGENTPDTDDDSHAYQYFAHAEPDVEEAEVLKKNLKLDAGESTVVEDDIDIECLLAVSHANVRLGAAQALLTLLYSM